MAVFFFFVLWYFFFYFYKTISIKVLARFKVCDVSLTILQGCVLPLYVSASPSGRAPKTVLSVVGFEHRHAMSSILRLDYGLLGLRRWHEQWQDTA
jgi:hypothetical protein